MRAAVIIFHKNIDTYYPREWVDKCYTTLRDQSYRNFNVFEVDYGGDGRQTWEGSRFYSLNLGNHADAHNFLLDRVFEEDYDCAFNVNVDDWYALNRFERQISAIEQGYDVVSSNFYRVNDDESVKQAFTFHGRDMVKEASKEHNVLAHPVLCYSRKFWLNCDKLKQEEIPFDDFMLWKRSYKKGIFRFIILPDYLLFQRIHSGNVSRRSEWKKKQG